MGHDIVFLTLGPKLDPITIFMTTHYLEEAENCDRIAIIDEGKIVACGTPEELKKSIKGDTISLKTTNDDKAKRWIEENVQDSSQST